MRNALLLLVLFGCTSSSDDSTSNHVDITSTPYTLQPGEEKYFCYTMRMPADREIAITKMTPTYGAATHHVLVAETIATEADGFSECPVLFRNTWVPLYTGGLDSGPLELPAGTGFKMLDKGQQILMQLHLQNATDAPITGTTKVRMDFVDATPDVETASIFGMDNRKIAIPPHTDSVKTEMTCMINRDLEVFAIMGHMHKRGVHLDVSRGATAGADMLYQEDWNFEQQPITPMPMHINKGDNLHLRCTHKNAGDMAIGYGESSDDEMCAFVLYYAPAVALDGCISE